MSIHIMNLVWRSTLEGCSRRFVLLALADRADDEGYCWPSVRTVARKSGLSESTVRRVYTDLEEAGLLWRQERWADNGRRDTNGYWINVEALEQTQHPRDADRSPFTRLEAVTTTGGGCHSERGEGVMVTPNTSVEPSSDPPKDSPGAASQRSCDGESTYPDDVWDHQDAEEATRDEQIDRCLTHLFEQVCFGPGDEAVARSMLERGEPYRKVLNTLRKRITA